MMSEDLFTKNEKLFPSMDQIYDLDTTQLSQLRNKVSMASGILNHDFKEELLSNIDLELEQRQTLEFFSQMLKHDNPYLQKINNFKEQFVKLAQISIENRTTHQSTQELLNNQQQPLQIETTDDQHQQHHNEQKDTHSEQQNNQTVSICSKDIDSRSVQVSDKKMNLHRSINAKAKKSMNQLLFQTLVKSKASDYHVITKNNHLSNSVKKNEKPHTQLKKIPKQEIKVIDNKAKQKQHVLKDTLKDKMKDKMKQIKKKMDSKPNPPKSQGLNNKKIVDMIRQQENIRLQKIKDRQRKDKQRQREKYKSQSEIKEEKTQYKQFLTSNVIQEEIASENCIKTEPLIKITHQNFESLKQKEEDQQKVSEINRQMEIVEEDIDCQQQLIEQQQKRKIIIQAQPIQQKIQQDEISVQDKEIQKNTISKVEITKPEKREIVSQKQTRKICTNQQISSQLNQRQTSMNSGVDIPLQKQQEMDTQTQRQNTLNSQITCKQQIQQKQLSNELFQTKKTEQSFKKREIKPRQNKECYDEQYWHKIRQDAELKLQRFKIQKQLLQSERKNNLIYNERQIISQKEDIIDPNKDIIEPQIIETKVIQIVKPRPKLVIPKKIRIKPQFDYLKIFPSFDHLFSVMYMKDNSLASTDIPSVMKEISSMFSTHLEKVKFRPTNFAAIFFPLEGPSNKFSSINPRNLIHHTEKTFVDLKKMVQRLEIFNENINGQYRSGKQLMQQQKQEKKYYRVIKTKEEVYDIISTSFLRRRGWQQLPHGCSLKTTWNLYWSWGKPDLDLSKLLTIQKINHFPYNKNLSRKDLLYKNLDSFRRNLKISMPFLPLTYTLPKQFSQFSSKFHQQAISSAYNYWIMKPIGKSRGRGIKVITNLSQLNYVQNIVVQKYISNPLLIEGYKFDMRIYVLVTSFHPLQAFVYREGFARFSTEKFTLNQNQIKNTFVHLTNFAINRQNTDAKTNQTNANSLSFESGSKISLKVLKGKLNALGYNFQNIWSQVHEIIIKSLLACSVHVPVFPSSFELFGYDIMIDDTGSCHLIEINSSPSLERAYMVDEVIKQALIDDIIDIVNPPAIDKVQLLNVITQRLNSKKKSSSEDDLIDLGRVLKQAPIRNIGDIPQSLGLFEIVAPCQLSSEIEKNIKSRSGANNMHNID